MRSIPDFVDENEFIEILRKICWEVSDLLKSYNRTLDNPKEFKINLKIINKENGPVTAADLAVSNLIKERINKYYPNANWDFLNEEDTNNKTFSLPWVWIIDPLDGTKDFINQTGEYAMHLALSYQKIPVFGIVLIPSREELWISQRNVGSWCESKSGKIKEFSAISNEISDDFKIVTSRSHMPIEFINLLKSIFNAEIIGMGSVGYKITSILRGENDLYVSYSSSETSSPRDWDMAAPYTLIKWLGGNMTDLYGKELKFLKDKNYKQEGVILASMKTNHQEICKEILQKIENFNIAN